jgi:bacillithiol biosynthesis cysteine-adding enzyme BshC
MVIASPTGFEYICGRFMPDISLSQITSMINWLDYRQVPSSAGGYSELFFHYLFDYPSVREYYPTNFRDDAAFETVMQRVTERKPDRKMLVQVLTEQNRGFSSSPQAFENIERLSKPETYAIVTGQQVGLFGGPLYTLYKAITTITLAERLRVKYPRRDFVPVFWLEGEDHDFAEMNHIGLLDRENTLVKVSYLPGGEMPERNVGAVGEMAFDATLDATFRSLEEYLPQTEFTGPIMAALRESYASGRTFNQAFAAWLNRLVGDHGLIFMSSNHPVFKRSLSPIFERELAEYPRSSQIVITRSAGMEQHYHAQVKPKSINLFLFHKGGRYLIEPRETDFSLKGTRAFFQKEELVQIVREHPEQISPNVVLRPICQDSLLPSLCYVAGPSEIAYHAQIQPLYEYFNIPQPVIYPRASASVVQGGLTRALDKYGLDLTEFFGNIDRMSAKVVQQISEIKLDTLFQNSGNSINNALNELKFGLGEVDPTLLGALANVSTKIETHMNLLKEKAIAAQKRRNETAVRQIEKAAAGILPGGSLQERELNALHFLNKHGFALVPWLFANLDITGFKHQVLTP